MKEAIEELEFGISDKKLMLKIARESLSYYLNTKKILDYDESILPDGLLKKRSVFVSLHKGRALRGCMGRMHSEKPLYKNIQDEVVCASTRDSRFPALKFTELPQICIEISILGPLKKINSPEDIVLGKHGILMKQGFSTGTFLPQVATSTGWTIEEFLGYCAKDKAGIGWDGWKTAELYTYTAEVFSEKNC